MAIDASIIRSTSFALSTASGNCPSVENANRSRSLRAEVKSQSVSSRSKRTARGTGCKGLLSIVRCGRRQCGNRFSHQLCDMAQLEGTSLRIRPTAQLQDAPLIIRH